MAAVVGATDVADDSGSISSVPESLIDEESDQDEMRPMDSEEARPAASTETSVKAREAQAERARSQRLYRQQAPSLRRDAQPSSSSHQAGPDPILDPDDVPPPSYSEAVQRGSRPDDALRYAWRQGITEGSLNLDSFSQLVSPTSETAPRHLRHFSASSNNQHAANQPRPDTDDTESTSIAAQAGRAPGYGSMTSPIFNQDRDAQRMGDEEESGPADALMGGSSRAPESGWFGRKWAKFGRGHDDSGPSRRGSPGGHDSNNEVYGSPDYVRRRNKRLRILAKVIVALAILVLCARLLSWIVKRSRSDDSNHHGKHDNDGDDDGDVTEPDNPEYDKSPRHSHRASLCQNAHYWTSFNAYSFNTGSDIRVIEALDYSRTTGTIRMVPAPPDQKYNISISLAMTASSDWSVDAVHFSIKQDGPSIRRFTVDDPRLYSGPDKFAPCLDVDIVMSFKPNVVVDNLWLDAKHLQILVADGVFSNSSETAAAFSVVNGTELRTRSGKISAAYVASRQTIIETQSGNVDGTFALYDLLSIHSNSGTIKARVDPQSAKKDDPTHPAQLSLRTNSGTISAHAPTSGHIPNRLYRTEVRTDSSSITGSYIFGPDAKFASYSGSIGVDLLPFIFDPPSDSSGPVPTASTIPHTPSPTPPVAPSPAPPPSVPTPPAIPDIPEIPKIPSIPDGSNFDTADVHFPSRPEVPRVPGVPDIPKIPSIPSVPAVPRPHMPSPPEVLPPDHNLVDRDGAAYSALSLTTKTVSSTTDLRVLSPYAPNEHGSRSSKKNFTLRSTHESVSGRVALRLPDAWTGRATVQSTSGHVSVRGSRLFRVSGSSAGPEQLAAGAFYGVKEVWERDDGYGQVGRSSVDVGTISSAIDVKFE